MIATTAYAEYCEASLDLSNQDDVGEAGAIVALDKLYANNDEGMKRLAKICGIARQGIEQYSEALSQLD